MNDVCFPYGEKGIISMFPSVRSASLSILTNSPTQGLQWAHASNKLSKKLNPASSSSTLSPSSIVWNRGDLFDAPNTEPCPSQSPYSSLSTGTWGPGARPSRCTNLDMYGVYSSILSDRSCVSRGPPNIITPRWISTLTIATDGGVSHWAGPTRPRDVWITCWRWPQDSPPSRPRG